MKKRQKFQELMKEAKQKNYIWMTEEEFWGKESRGQQDIEMVHKQQMLERKEKEKNEAVTKISDEI